MDAPAHLAEFFFSSPEFPVCVVNVPVADLAGRLCIPLTQWEEPGLGGATGFGCKMASGLLVRLEELAHARANLGAKGPTVYVQAHELIERGIQGTLAEILVGIALSPENVTWSQSESGVEAARQMVQAADAPDGKHVA